MRYHIMFSSKGDNRSVYIASSYRNENGQSRKNIVRRCGNLKKLLATDPKALEKIEAEVRSLNEKAAGEDIKKRLLDNETIEADIIRAAKDGIMLKGEKPCLRGLGMIVLDRLWNKLNLPYKLSYLKKDCDVQFDFEEVVKQLCLEDSCSMVQGQNLSFGSCFLSRSQGRELSSLLQLSRFTQQK